MQPSTDLATTRAWEIVVATLRVSHRLRSLLDRALDGCGLSFAQFEALGLLEDEPKLHAAELGRRLRISRQAAHALLQQLARADLVDLLPPDGGILGAVVTTSGRKRILLARRATDHILRRLAEVPAHVSQQTLEALSQVEAVIIGRPEAWWLH